MNKQSLNKPLSYRGRYSTIGIDLGTSLVKMLQLKQIRGKIYLYQKCLFSTPEGALENGKITNSSSLLEQLQQAKQKFRWHGNRVSLCLDNRAFYMHTVVMPLLKSGELERAMHWEAKKHFPLALDEAVISYQYTADKTHKGNPAREYLLAAVAKRTADQYTELAVRAGFNPISLETVTPVLLRSTFHSVNTNSTDHSNYRLIVDLGNKCSNLLLVDNKGYCYHRSLNMGIVNFCEAVHSVKAGSPVAALKRTFSTGSLTEKGLHNIAGKLARSINESLEYWSGHNSKHELDLNTIEVSGGGIFIPGLASFLQNELGLKLKLYNPFRLFNSSRDEQNVSGDYRGVLFSLAHGLALRGWLR